MPATTLEKTQIPNPNQTEQIDQGCYYTPAVDIFETNTAFVLRGDLPGVRAEDLSIQFDKGVLNLEGRVRPRGPVEKDYLWREYGTGHFARSFNVDVPVKAEEIKATLKLGELTVNVPKSESARTRQIPIRTQ